MSRPLILRAHHAQIGIPKGAETAAREFYQDLLGLKEIEKPQALRGRGGFWLELDSFQLHVGIDDRQNAAEAAAGTSREHVAYEVSDLTQWRRRLEDSGIRVKEGIPIPGYARVEFRDPFGNRVEFLQKTGAELRFPVELESPNLTMREWTWDDWEGAHEYAKDPEVVKYELWGPNTEAQTQEFVRLVVSKQSEVPRKRFEFAVILKSSGCLIGGCGMRIQNEAQREADLGYALRRDHWGRGLGTEAARAVLRFGFERLKLHRIWATCHAENKASARVLEKSGMSREGILKGHRFQQGAWRDSLLYAVTDERSSP